MLSNRANPVVGRNVSDFILMPAIDLAYKSGEPAYVGDLFKSDNPKNQEAIIYRIWPVHGGFATNTSVDFWQKDIKSDYPFPSQSLSDEQMASWFSSSAYCIGNIYENPNLLEL